MSLILPETTTPEALAAHLGWSERRVRDLARRLGACRILGNRMALLPDDVEIILAAAGGPELRVEAKAEPAPRSYLGSHVYFFQQAHFVKIGWSNKWRARLAIIQSNTPFEVTALAVYRGGITMERSLHAMFFEHRVRLEWFYRCEAIESYIVANKSKCLKDAKNSLLRDGQ